ncbi:MAG TPA: DUF4157 domain-containing protein [Kofleriaceae bacterium]|nr:DUF4157 domain-containing protein [Kofleriaceae bacterium]
MNAEREFDRTHAAASAGQLDNLVAPNRATKSSLLDAPNHPEASGLAMRKADRDGVHDDAGAKVAVASDSTGTSLPGELQTRFESSLGVDLSGVQLHTGNASAAAASSLGARAYATGSDIHFASGQYDPSSRGGQTLLAHEVAHTVQQGTARKLQHKLEVSGAHDAAEVEADHAAEAMVRGASFSVSIGSGIQRKIFRDKETKGKLTDADKAEAQRIQTSVDAVRAATLRARTTINGDATAASRAISQTRQLYKDFESTYRAAVAKFNAGVNAARAKQDMFDKGLSIAADLALKGVGAIGGVAGEFKEMYDTMSKAKLVLTTAEGLLAAPGAAPPPMPTSAAGKGDWEGLLNTLGETFSKYTALNTSLTNIDAKCTEAAWVQNIANGTLAPVPADLWGAGNGKAARQFATQATAVITQLGTIQAGMLSTRPQEFLAKVNSSLPGQTIDKLEKDVAMRWIASLQPADMSAISSARTYLKKIGVIDAAGNSLGVTSALGSSVFGLQGFDQKLILARAKVDQRAKELVGQAVYWSYKGGGTINDPDDGARYAAHGTLDPAGSKDSQRVLITGYKMNRGDQIAMYGLADQGKGDPMGQVQSEVTFEFVPYKAS